MSGHSVNSVIIDGLNVFMRNWIVNPMMNNNGVHIGGVVGFLKQVGDIVSKYNPDTIFVVFDGVDATVYRKGIIPEYRRANGLRRFRVNRQYTGMLSKSDELASMKSQFVWLINVMKCLPIKIVMVDGVESIDVIAYLSEKNTANNTNSVIVSTDSIYVQLINETVKLYNQVKNAEYTNVTVSDLIGFNYTNYVLFKSVDGVSSYGITGIQGAGLKTLVRRIPEFVNTPCMGLELLIDTVKAKVSNLKLYQSILSGSDIILTNMTVLTLNPNLIVDNTKQRIDAIYDSDDVLNKMQFIRMITEYDFSNKWIDMVEWVGNTFRNTHKKTNNAG